MKLVTIPYSRLDPGNALARDYCVQPEKVLPLFRQDYRDPAGFGDLADLQARRARPKLGPILEAYNREVGGDAARAARIDDELCVVSGQQVGLLLGPAYTTYKLFTVVNAARKLEESLGRPVTPVFWVESEDHDWDEVNRFYWKGQRHRIESSATGGSVAHIDVNAAEFLDQMRSALGREDSAAWNVVAVENNIARWHVRNLARLVPNVVFLEPRLLREPMREFAERVASESGALDASIQRDTGYAPRLSPPKGAYLFDSAQGSASGRTRVARGEPCPERWSTDVASRVLVQNAALPVLAAVCGPAEIDYWSQLGAAHDHFDVPMPAVLPRDAATLIESGVVKDASRLDLDLEQLVLGTAKPAAPGTSDPVADRLRSLAGEASELFGAVESGELDLPPNADKPFRRTVGRLGDDLEKLAARLEDARAEAAGAGKRRFEKIQEELRPRGGLQERTHSLFPYLLRHGPGLADQLRSAFDPFEIGHYLVLL